MKAHSLRSEADLEALIGESESIDLEFKGPDDFLSWPANKENIRKDLSKEVSAFANTYGGQIVIGIRETRESPRRAEVLGGVDPRRPPIETIQRLIEGNIHPRLEGIRYYTIELSGKNVGRVAYVIVVPQGLTAYQAQDKIYYGRSEYECVPLDDQLIRYKMALGRAPTATIKARKASIATSSEEYEKRQKRLHELTEKGNLIRQEQRETLNAPPRSSDQYSLQLFIENTGRVTIRDCLLATRLRGLPTRGDPGAENSLEQLEEQLFPMLGNRRMGGLAGSALHSVDSKIFPSQERQFPGAALTFDLPGGSSLGESVLAWTLYLDDSPPISGQIRLSDCFGEV